MSTVDNEKPPYVAFEIRSVENRAESIAKGHYVARDVIFVTVTRPGGRDSHEEEAESWISKLEKRALEGQVPGAWPVAFRQALEAFKRNETLPETGTPVKGWQVLAPSAQQAIIRAGFRTVEDLAKASESEIASIGMGAISYRQKAQAWLAEAKEKGTSVEAISSLKQQVDELTSLAERLVEENKALKAQLPQPQKLPTRS